MKLEENMNIEQISAQFAFQGVYAGYEELTSGNINSTYHLSYRYPRREYILQRINHYVFKRPDYVMENMLQVTGYLAAKYQAMSIDPSKRVINLIPLHADGYMYVSPE